MKKLTIFILLIISNVAVKAAEKQAIMKNDTTVVEFTDKGTKKRLSVYTNGKHDFQIPSQLNLDNLLKEIGVDSSERKKAIILISQNGDKKDTVLVITRDGRKIKIVTNEPKGSWSGTSRSDTLRRDEPERNVQREENYDHDRDSKPRDRKYERYFSRSDFNLYLGLNNWFSKNSAVQAPALSPLGSRYVALSWRRNITLIKGRGADLALSYSPEVLWYNFMFDGNKYANTSNGQVQFTDYGKNLSKSKLVVPTLNLPVMLTIGLKESRFQFGVGGYIGYRIDSYTKVKFEDGGGTEHHHESFNLNDVRYGLTAELGRKNGLRLFFRYDLNEMFQTSQKNATNIQGWSVGVKLL